MGSSTAVPSESKVQEYDWHTTMVAKRKFTRNTRDRLDAHPEARRVKKAIEDHFEPKNSLAKSRVSMLTKYLHEQTFVPEEQYLTYDPMDLDPPLRAPDVPCGPDVRYTAAQKAQSRDRWYRRSLRDSIVAGEPFLPRPEREETWHMLVDSSSVSSTRAPVSKENRTSGPTSREPSLENPATLENYLRLPAESEHPNTLGAPPLTAQEKEQWSNSMLYKEHGSVAPAESNLTGKGPLLRGEKWSKTTPPPTSPPRARRERQRREKGKDLDEAVTPHSKKPHPSPQPRPAPESHAEEGHTGVTIPRKLILHGPRRPSRTGAKPTRVSKRKLSSQSAESPPQGAEEKVSPRSLA